MAVNVAEHLWRVVSVYSDGRRHVEGRWLTRRAAEFLVEDIQIYREENPPLDGSDEPRLVVEKAGSPEPQGGTE